MSVYLDTNVQDKIIEVSNNEKITLEENERLINEQTAVYPYRFFILVMFVGLNFSGGMQWVTYASIATNFGISFNLTSTEVDLLSLIFMIIYPFTTFPSSYMIDQISMRVGLMIASIFVILGGLLKIFTSEYLFLAYIGQFLVGAVQPLILNSPGKIASTWFKPEHRVLVTSIAALANTFGFIFGYLISTFFYDKNTPMSEFKTVLRRYLITQFIITVVLCAPTIFFMKNKPKIPPSLSQKQVDRPNLIESLKLLFRNKNFNLLLTMFTFIIGFLNFAGTKINEVISRYGIITQDQISDSVSVAAVGGILGSIIMSMIVDKSKKYKPMFIILSSVSLASIVILTILLQILKNQTIFFVSFLVLLTLIDFSIVPIFTISYDLVIELTYPVGESVSAGIIMSASQLSGVIFILLDNLAISQEPRILWISPLMCILMIFFSTLCLVFFKQKLFRLKKDRISIPFPTSD